MPNVVHQSYNPATGVRHDIVDRTVLARTTGYSPSTIRKWCPPHDYDPATGRALYDRDIALAQLAAAGAVARPGTRGPRTASRMPNR